MELACHFGPVLLPYVSENDDEELCFKKKFGFKNFSRIAADSHNGFVLYEKGC